MKEPHRGSCNKSKKDTFLVTTPRKPRRVSVFTHLALQVIRLKRHSALTVAGQRRIFTDFP